MEQNNWTAENNENVFEYTYSAKNQKEIEKIRKKYLPCEEDKFEQIKKLDKSAEQPGTIAALTIGIMGLLIFGMGLSLTILAPELYIIHGIMIGCTGMAMMGAAYPLYQHITRKQRAKIAPQILELCEEVLK